MCEREKKRFFCSFEHTKKRERVTSWKSCDISHTKQELLCISHLCRSDRKKSRNSGVCVSAWTMQFMKHVLPRFIRPRRPEGKGRTLRKPDHFLGCCGGASGASKLQCC